eukprot:6184020-Pleurochrysis_carterae.AAC.1
MRVEVLGFVTLDAEDGFQLNPIWLGAVAPCLRCSRWSSGLYVEQALKFLSLAGKKHAAMHPVCGRHRASS